MHYNSERTCCELSKSNMTLFVSGEKSKHRWNNIHTMAEAKAGLQALLNMVNISVYSSLCGFAFDRMLVG